MEAKSHAVPPQPDRFRVLDVLGQGFSGVVYRVHDEELETTLALKALAAHDAEKLYRLKQEFRILADIRHPNLVELYELISSGEDCGFTMEYVDGVDIVSHIRQAGTGRDLLRRLLGTASQLVEGISAIHDAGRLHRDVKPNNIMVARDSGRVVVLDFGFAVLLRPDDWNLKASTTLSGTIAYMAPELLMGEQPTTESDWYGVGVILFEALTGQLPFDGPEAMMRKGTTPPPAVSSLVPDVPSPVDDLVHGLLDPNPNERIGAATALDLLGAVGFAPTRRPNVSAPSTTFVGRDQELTQLREGYAATANGQATAVRVLGASGIGKSELIRRFLSEIASTEDVVVLSGRCHPQETLPYQAFDGCIDTLSRFLEALPETEVATLMPRHAGALAQQFPVLARLPAFAGAPMAEGADPRETRRRSFGALRELLGRIAERHRLVLWIDDMQWADQDSAELASEIFRAPDPPVLMLIASCRSEESEQNVVLSALGTVCNVADEPSSTRMKDVLIDPLSPTEMKRLAAELGGADDVDSIVEECGGSPFLITQLTQHLPETQRHADVARADASTGLTAFLEDRVERLPPPAQRLIETVSVAGRPIDRSLALDAAGLEERARPLARNLERERFLRSALLDNRPTIELYHDKIREAALARMGASRQVDIHRQLANVLSRQEAPDPEELYVHFLGAHDEPQAAEWAVRAGDRKAAALAFADAARLYEDALHLIPWERADHVRLLVKRADSLVNAGHGAKAAGIYLEASSLIAGTEAIDLRRRAGEQFLITGSIDQGAEVLRDLLADVGVSYPKSAFSTLRRTLASLAKLAFRGLRVGTRPTSPTPLETLSIDLCHSAAKGLAMVDPFLGVYFAVTMLLRAQALGDQRRFAIALAGLGATLSPTGGLLQRWAGSMFDRASELSTELDDPYLNGYLRITTAQRSMIGAKWGEMLDLCDSGSDILRAECRGVAWELGIGSMAAMRALEELGDIAEVRQRATQMLGEGESTGDLYGTVTALLMLGVADKLQGRTAEARACARRVASLWTLSGFHVQHFYALRIEIYCDLLEGQPTNALKRLDDAWPQIQSAGLLRHTLLRTDAHLLRARAALAAAASSTQPGKLLHDAETAARQLSGEERPDAVAAAELVRSGIAAHRNDRPGAVALLEQSERTFQENDMKLAALASRWQRSALSEEPRTLTPEDQAYIEAEGISEPDELFRVLAPGFESF